MSYFQGIKYRLLSVRIIARAYLWLSAKYYHFSPQIHHDIRHIVESARKSGFRIQSIYKDYVVVANQNLVCRLKVAYPWIFNEVFVLEIYKFHKPLDTSQQYILIDIGANVGYAALYFATQTWCKEVLSFELLPQNIAAMQENLVLNASYIQQKITLYPYGLGKMTDTTGGGGVIMASYFENRDGISSMIEGFLQNYAPEEKGREILTQCEIRSASQSLKALLESSDTPIIMKIDVEGAEYEIFEDIATHYPEIFERVVKIIGDTHLGFEPFYNIVRSFGFEVVFKQDQENLTCPFELERVKS